MTGTKRFTGYHMTAIMLAFFGVVIAVNVTMATLAARTFGGTVVDNSYVASQRFNRWLADARAQDRLGWRTSLSLDAGRRVVASVSVPDVVVEAVARHPLGRAPDMALRFEPDGAGRWRSRASLPPGRWLVHLEVRRGRFVLRSIESLS
jgi:nitrogen fixation protein FixH